MANINTNGFIVAAISIIVSIILVTGVLIPVIADNSGTERTVLYTNTGEWYYNEVTDDTNTTITLGTYEYEENSMFFAQLKVTIDDNEPIETAIPEWTSERSMDVTALPIFIFKTNDGKYGVEGIVAGCGGDQIAEAEYFKMYGGLVYYRFIQGDSEPTIYYPFTDDATISVTLSNKQVTVNGMTIPQINGTYELYLTGQTSGEYVLGDTLSVIDSTEFYCCGWCGSTSIETSGETGDPIVVYENVVGSIGKGTVSSILDSSNFSYCVIDSHSSPTATFELDTQPTEDEKGTVINYIDVILDEIPLGAIYRGFIVPVEIAEGGESAMSPTLKSMVSVIPLIVIVGLIVGTVGYFLRKQ